MAREDLKELYQELKRSRFQFVPRGTHHIDIIYREVKSRFPHLCDDSYLCAENCSSGHSQPEWNHTIRKALESLKGESVLKDDRKGFWTFA